MTNKLSEILYKKRGSSGKTQKTVAQEAGVQQSGYSRIENGKILRPARQTLEKIGKVLDIPIEELERAANESECLLKDKRRNAQENNCLPDLPSESVSLPFAFIRALSQSSCTQMSFEDLDFLTRIQKELMESLTTDLIQGILAKRKKEV